MWCSGNFNVQGIGFNLEKLSSLGSCVELCNLQVLVRSSYRWLSSLVIVDLDKILCRMVDEPFFVSFVMGDWLFKGLELFFSYS